MANARTFMGNALRTAAHLGHQEVVKVFPDNVFDITARVRPFADALGLAIRNSKLDTAIYCFGGGAAIAHLEPKVWLRLRDLIYGSIALITTGV
ncbi:predicted protein [Uncinocarpus reesii 1704]|uniref:Uncharacterized protein n=1 Tax=Uncinocarpus reesii (strain UAMH 1704) TaxID=336963 RepID=C4JS72_UNCRE|nr:uncharacterized protein UREG_05311 [Uncinocarpus reesii 1704]EEP80469.1 predicted protein [Uncinocarpus reesii 1704]